MHEFVSALAAHTTATLELALEIALNRGETDAEYAQAIIAELAQR